MTLSTAPGDRTRLVEPLDFYSKEHRSLLFDLAWSDRKHLLNDHDNDVLLIINEYHSQQQNGQLYAFLSLVKDKPVGATWLEVDRYGIGRVHSSLLPEHRNIWNGLYFLRQLVAFSFDQLALRKLDAEFALYKKADKQSAAYERSLKRIGFTKRAILPESLMLNGKPKDTILLDYLKRDYDVKKEKQ